MHAYSAVAILCVIAALPAPARAATESIVYSFPRQGHGKFPSATLLRLGGKLYGTTVSGGKYDDGTLFFIGADGKQHIIYEFRGGTDGASPNGLVNLNGDIYGTTNGGGDTACGNTHGCGTIFSLVPPHRTYKQLYVFTGGTDGQQPVGAPVALNGMLYGATEAGGTGGDICADNCGTVYSFTPAGQETTLYAFKGGNDGAYPTGLITDGSMFYGTTSSGGVCSITGSCGTVFSVTPQGAEKIIYAFQSVSKGAQPNGHLVKIGNDLYGTTFEGGMKNRGTIFKVSLSGDYKRLYAFDADGTEGDNPYAGLTEMGGTLYGTTTGGGSTGDGTIFSITRSGVFKTLYNFAGPPDGAQPFGVMTNVSGVLYGTTLSGGGSKSCPGGCGTVFKLIP